MLKNKKDSNSIYNNAFLSIYYDEFLNEYTYIYFVDDAQNLFIFLE